MTVRDVSGILFVVSAPSGTGKSTLARRLLERVDNLEFSVSYTTRASRETEEDGTHYHFVDEARFDRMIESGGLLEWACVFDKRYGTGLEATRCVLEQGRDLLLDIDVQGVRQVGKGPIPAVSVMILPPNYATLETRLSGRGSEDETTRRSRLSRARHEAEDYGDFDYTVVNDELESTVSEIESIVRAERRRSGRCRDEAERILATFPA